MFSQLFYWPTFNVVQPKLVKKIAGNKITPKLDKDFAVQ